MNKQQVPDSYHSTNEQRITMDAVQKATFGHNPGAPMGMARRMAVCPLQ